VRHAEFSPEALGGNVLRWRGLLGISVRELADRAGVSYHMIRDIERGRRSARLPVVCSIARALSVTPSDLLVVR
jgi:transcriptional regulator with XRE-family HTH domain